MFHINISEDYLVLDGGSSDGIQIKYFNNGYWYKTDAFGQEGMIEYLVSGILQYSSLRTDEYVKYEFGTINHQLGCRSKNFLKKDSVFITFQRLHKNVTGKGMNEAVNQIDSLDKKVDYVITFIKNVCGIDVTKYLQKTFTLDYLILNEDRHFNNLGLIMRSDETYYTAPIFDNGKSLFCGNFSVKDNLSLEENFKRVVCQPFGYNHKKIYEFFGKGFNLDMISAVSWLEKQTQTKERDLLICRIKNILTGENI